MDPSLRVPISALVLVPSNGDGDCRDTSDIVQKNWVFLRVDRKDADRLLFIYSFGPYTVVSCHIQTGCCLPRPDTPFSADTHHARHARLQAVLDGYRGGLPVTPVGDGSTVATVVHIGGEFPVGVLLHPSQVGL